ncbi:MAG TPA: hypothetical protein VFH43_07600 [Candidatus Kapabacteria bacterium]|jgi:glycine cleavage system regulatory protein|nr:hypothetical protein [Candidatus Kapabacteria bacterium]
MHLRINATTDRERYGITKEIQDALTRNGGYVLDSHLYSNISTVLNIEIPGTAIDELLNELEALGMRIKCERPRGESDQDVRGTLQITFVHNDPDIRHEVPMVPG